MQVHNTTVTNGTEARPGSYAIWGAYGGLKPTYGSSSCLHRSTLRSRGARSRRAQASSSMELFLYHRKPSRISADTSLIPTPLRS